MVSPKHPTTVHQPPGAPSTNIEILYSCIRCEALAIFFCSLPLFSHLFSFFLPLLFSSVLFHSLPKGNMTANNDIAQWLQQLDQNGGVSLHHRNFNWCIHMHYVLLLFVYVNQNRYMAYLPAFQREYCGLQDILGVVRLHHNF